MSIVPSAIYSILCSFLTIDAVHANEVQCFVKIEEIECLMRLSILYEVSFNARIHPSPPTMSNRK